MKNVARFRRHTRITRKIKGDQACPRLVVFRSNKHIYAQVINDGEHKILAGFSTLAKEFKAKNIKTTDKSAAKELGKMIAAKMLNLGVKSISFDRGGYKYHGRVKALADGAREGGLKF